MLIFWGRATKLTFWNSQRQFNHAATVTTQRVKAGTMDIARPRLSSRRCLQDRTSGCSHKIPAGRPNSHGHHDYENS